MKRSTKNERVIQLACGWALVLGLAGSFLPVDGAELPSADAATVAVEGLDAAGAPAGRSLPELLQWGPFEVRPYFTGSLLYDDNIRVRSANPISDVVWTLSPGVLIGGGQYDDPRGTYLTLDYRPDIVLYTDQDEFNSVDHWANFVGQKRWEKLTLGLGQAFQSGVGGYTEALNRVDRTVYVTTVRALYDLSDKTSFELNGLQNISEYNWDVTEAPNRVPGFNQWEGQAWMNWQATPKFNAGVGGSAGWRDVQQAVNQTYQQALVRGTYVLTDKTRFDAKVGMEFQQYQAGGDRGPQLVFDVNGTYRPWDRTLFRLGAYRRNQNSVVVAGQNYTATGFRASVRQQMWRKLAVTVTGGYEESDYYATGGTAPINRNDQYYYLGPALDYAITERWFLGVFYRYRSNDSTVPSSDFDNNQAGLRSGFRF